MNETYLLFLTLDLGSRQCQINILRKEKLYVFLLRSRRAVVAGQHVLGLASQSYKNLGALFCSDITKSKEESEREAGEALACIHRKPERLL